MRKIVMNVACSFLLFAGVLSAQQTNRAAGSASTTGATVADDSDLSAEGARQSILTFSPAALEAVARRAEVRNSFTLDRTALGALGAFMPDTQDGLRPAIRKLNGISVHLYRFHDLGAMDQAKLEEVRQAYDARGWKHLVSEGRADSLHKRTDLWLTFDGMDVRGGAMMLVTPRSVSVVTFAGDLNPIDVLRLRGHFGIPAASNDSSSGVK